MSVKLRLSSRLTLSGVIVAVLLSSGTAIAGTSEDCVAAAAYVYGQQDYTEALRLCRPLAEQGDAKAQSALGLMYTNGEGVQKDYAEAAKWYRKAADQGYARAQSALGYLYANGSGAPQDYAEARKWYDKAAEQGDFPAQFWLGLGYWAGQQMPKDYVLAHMWLNLAATHSRADFAEYADMADLLGEQVKSAADMRDELAAKMTPDQIAEAQRLAREWKPTK
jgi:TPR repeat protein